MCIEQKSNWDPIVLCSTRTKSKRNSSRLDMHREAKNCNWAVQQPGCSNGSSYIRRPHHVPVQKILSSLRMARAIRSKTLLSSLRKARRSYPFYSKPTIANFLNSSSQSVEKTQDVTRAKKSSAVRASASRSKKIVSLLLSCLAEMSFMSGDCSPDIKEKSLHRDKE